MRLAIEYFVSGKDLAEITEKARAEWRRIMGNDKEDLPGLVEVKVRSNEEGGDLIGYVSINTKVENS